MTVAEVTVLLLVATLCSAVATWFARALARRCGVVAKPNPIVSQHTRSVACLGGAGIAVGVLVSLGILAALTPTSARDTYLGDRLILALPVAGAGYLVLGLVDDVVKLRPALKFVGQSIVAIVAISMGMVAPCTGQPLVDAALSWFWIVTLVNAFNMTDVCDGLVGGLSLVTFAFIGLSGPGFDPLALAVAGACAGFLFFNIPRATIFLGDGGSHLLGFLAAAGTMNLIRDATSADRVIVFAQVVLFVAVPLFESVFITLVRVRKREPWWRGSPDHFSLRMQAAGLTALQTDVIAWAAAVILCLVSVALTDLGPWGRFTVLLLVLGALLSSGVVLLRYEIRA